MPSARQAPQTDWHREDIKAAIRKRGATLESLAIMNGYSRSAVRMTLIRPSPAIQNIIARFLGYEAKDIWPSRYNADGTPRRASAQVSHHGPATPLPKRSIDNDMNEQQP